MLIIFIAASCLCFSEESEDYQFIGKHFLASYYGCDKEILNDKEVLSKLMAMAVYASGATIIGECAYQFDPHGITILYLLSESHASIHTYPEHGACFVDIFTCGLTCDPLKFDEKLSLGLHAESSKKELKIRD